MLCATRYYIQQLKHWADFLRHANERDDYATYLVTNSDGQENFQSSRPAENRRSRIWTRKDKNRIEWEIEWEVESSKDTDEIYECDALQDFQRLLKRVLPEI